MNDYKSWEWHGQDYCLGNSSNFELLPCQEDPSSIFDEATPIKAHGEEFSYHNAELLPCQEDISSIFDEATPIKACGEDFSYHVAESMRGKYEESRETKRRRVLQFNSIDSDEPLFSNEMSPFLKSKELEYSIEDSLPEVYQSPSQYKKDTDPSYEEWINECLKDVERKFFSDDDTNFSEPSHVQADMPETCIIISDDEADMVQERIVVTPGKIIIKGSKCCIQTPPKPSSSVVSPFAIVKTCGDLTLKDINQRIRTPPSMLKRSDEGDLSACYPTSAFSGKPVVGQTKIHTHGGKGSITILRTKG